MPCKLGGAGPAPGNVLGVGGSFQKSCFCWFEAVMSNSVPGSEEGIEGYRREYLFYREIEENVSSRNILAAV